MVGKYTNYRISLYIYMVKLLAESIREDSLEE